MQKSKKYILAETGIRKSFFRTRGGISIPPVEAPERITIPKEIPMPRPEKMVQSKMSVVRIQFPSSLSQISREAGYKNVLANVVSAKDFPSTIHPSKSIHILKIKINTEMEIPK